MKVIKLIILIAVILLWIGFVQIASGYQPLTEKEAEEWIGSISFDELLEFVIKYDYVENVTPEVSGGDFIIVLSGRDIYLEYQNKMRVKIGYLEYDFELENKVYEDFVPREKIMKAIGISSGVGVLVGIVLMLLIL